MVQAAGVTVRYGYNYYFTQLALPFWAPQPGWQLAFGAATGRGTDNHWIEKLHVSTGAYVDKTPVPVTVSLNGQQFAREALTYTYNTIYRNNPIIPEPSPPPALPSPPAQP